MTIAANTFPSKPERIYTLQAYLDREAKAVHKSCFYNGIIVKMPGAKFKHNLIATNTTSAINAILLKEEQRLTHNYIVVNSDQKIHIPQEDAVVYPDALVICEQPEFWEGREDVLTNPLVVVEVLSKSTRKYDMNLKFDLYRLLPSFKEYVLIDQDKQRIEVWTRKDEKTWEINTYTNIDDEVILYAVENIKISLSSIYKNIQF